jgi:hypothetical protein
VETQATSILKSRPVDFVEYPWTLAVLLLFGFVLFELYDEICNGHEDKW